MLKEDFDFKSKGATSKIFDEDIRKLVDILLKMKYNLENRFPKKSI